MAVFRFRPGRFPISAKSLSDFGLEFGGQNRGRKLTKKSWPKTDHSGSECERARNLGSSASNFFGRFSTIKPWPILDSDLSFQQKMKGFARKFGRAPRENWEGSPKKIGNASVASKGGVSKADGPCPIGDFFGRKSAKVLAEN